jgi:dihydroorotase
MSRLIVEGNIVTHKNKFYGQIEIDQKAGLIARVGEGRCFGSADIKAEGLIFPGFGDLHVHAREDTSEKDAYKEEFYTASLAAINGGVTHFAEMPNNPIAPTTDGRYGAKKLLAEEHSFVPVTLYAGIGPGTEPLSSNVPYKVFMGPSVGDLFFESQPKLEQTIRNYRGKNVSFHCEDPEVLRQNKERETHELKRPNEAEVLAIEFALNLIELYGLAGKICHCSTRKGLELVLRAKARGVNVTVEVAPHHLFFDESMLTDENRRWLQVNPPIRSVTDRMYLLEKMRNKEFDYLATDHAPHTKEEKLKGMSGMPQLDTYGPFVTWLMKECGIPPEEIAMICSFNPGNFVNPFLSEQYGKGFGRIEEGYAGSLTILNPNVPTVVSEEKLGTKCKWSPFTGVTFPGSVERTIVMGKVYDLVDPSIDILTK